MIDTAVLRVRHSGHVVPIGDCENEEIIAYCRIGEGSSITWFAHHELLGYENVVSYDDSSILRRERQRLRLR